MTLPRSVHYFSLPSFLACSSLTCFSNWQYAWFLSKYSSSITSICTHRFLFRYQLDDQFVVADPPDIRLANISHHLAATPIYFHIQHVRSTSPVASAFNNTRFSQFPQNPQHTPVARLQRFLQRNRAAVFLLNLSKIRKLQRLVVNIINHHWLTREGVVISPFREISVKDSWI